MEAETCGARAPFVQSLAIVSEQQAVSARYFLLRLKCRDIAERAQPGQFIMLACTPDTGGPPGTPVPQPDPLLPRPMAVMDVRGDEIELLYLVQGHGTELLRQTAQTCLGLPLAERPGLRIIGPLGRPFTPIPGVDAHVGLGGGSGTAPLVFFSEDMRAHPPLPLTPSRKGRGEQRRAGT